MTEMDIFLSMLDIKYLAILGFIASAFFFQYYTLFRIVSNKIKEKEKSQFECFNHKSQKINWKSITEFNKEFYVIHSNFEKIKKTKINNFKFGWLLIALFTIGTLHKLIPLEGLEVIIFSLAIFITPLFIITVYDLLIWDRDN
ncbi:MAG: hypothetical protein WC376_02670 [Candidatus Nanoarchaeia archaeon]